MCKIERGIDLDPNLQLRLLMFAIWSFMVFRTSKSFYFGISSSKWPKVKASVKTSSIDRIQNLYSPKIIYEYVARGARQINDTYTYMGLGHFSKSRAIETAQLYPVGREIDIHVNPDNPKVSVILPGIHWVHYASFILVTGFCVFVAFIDPILNSIWPGCAPRCT